MLRKNQKIKSTVIITTDKVYDTTKTKIFKESDILGGHDPYSASKVSCEHLFSSYIHSFFERRSNQKLATVRAGNVIGGGDYSENRLIPDILRSIKKVKKIILRNPNSVRPWQHVLEPLNGYLLLAEKLYKNEKRIRNIKQNWNFGPNISNCKSVRNVAEFFAKRLKLKIKVAKTKDKIFTPETSLLRLGNFKSKKYLKWHPKWSLEKSLKKVLDWYYLTKTQNPRNVCENQIREFIEIN